jgi:hypothetical protein
VANLFPSFRVENCATIALAGLLAESSALQAFGFADFDWLLLLVLVQNVFL